MNNSDIIISTFIYNVNKIKLIEKILTWTSVGLKVCGHDIS